MFIADQPQFSHDEEAKRKERTRLFEERKAGTEEYCNECLALLCFPQSLHVNHPRRFQGGATYGEDGTGQKCGKCTIKFQLPQVEDLYGPPELGRLQVHYPEYPLSLPSDLEGSAKRFEMLGKKKA